MFLYSSINVQIPQSAQLLYLHIIISSLLFLCVTFYHLRAFVLKVFYIIIMAYGFDVILYS